MRKVSFKTILLFLFIPVFLYTVFFVWPTIQALFISLTKWNGYSTEKVFVGLDNYARLLHDEYFKIAVENTLVYMVGGGLFVFFLSLLFCFLISLPKMRGKKFFRGLFYFPNMLSSAAIALLCIFALNPSFGLVDPLLRKLGLDELILPWLGARWPAIGCMIFISSWSCVGYYFLILLSGMDKIPLSYYEAARLDGASELQIFSRITMPMMKDVVLINLMLWIINSVKVFDIPWALTLGGPSNQTHTIATYLYQVTYGVRQFVTNDKGLGTAIAVVMLLMIAVGRAITARMQKDSIEM